MDSKNMFPWILLSVFVSACLAVDPKDICPPRDLITPCYCEKSCVFCHVSLKCDNLLNQEVLTDVINKSNDYQYATFELRKSSVMYVPASIFAIQKIESLYIFSTSMVSWFDHPPSVNYDLDVFHLNEVRLSRSVQWNMFSGIKSLKRLSIMHTVVRRLDSTFKNNIPKNLKELVIYNCSISKLDDDIFTPFRELQSLEVETGKLKEVKRNNPIKCDCSILWITSIDRSHWKGPYYTGECASPKELAGKELKYLSRSDLQHC
ncbi:uncharacterized protein NPIL_166811 [Nephila pilipes]|uniref:Uncharacterized protein n=1 Tax=Nephila pilipes TaxID=299642 RepID=A0A8X6Q6A4_NEPPI|nr:uncharacterized protein NPIL_166811 [Nephila pilipes]